MGEKNESYSLINKYLCLPLSVMTVKGSWCDTACMNMDSVPPQENIFDMKNISVSFLFFKKKVFFTEFFNISLRCS